MLQKLCSSLVRASVFLKKLTLVSTSRAWKKKQWPSSRDHQGSTLHEDNPIPQVNYLNALEAGKSQWDESSRNDTRPFWNIFMTCCCRLTKYSNNCLVSASFKYIKNGMNQVASCTSSWCKGSNIQYVTHKPFRDEAFKQIMEAHEEWQACHGYARACNNHEAS
jgi:hypothetical protein